LFLTAKSTGMSEIGSNMSLRGNTRSISARPNPVAFEICKNNGNGNGKLTTYSTLFDHGSNIGRDTHLVSEAFVCWGAWWKRGIGNLAWYKD
jgi:hypothetical protein